MNTIAIPRPLDPRATPTLRSGMPARSPITISRVIRDEAEALVSCALPGDDAYAASIAVRDLPSVDIWLHNRRVARAGCAASGLYLFDLQSEPMAVFDSAYDFVRFYISRSALEQLSRDAGSPVTRTLKQPEFGASDRVLFNLARSTLPALDRPDEPNQLFIDHIALAFHAHLVLSLAGPGNDTVPARGGLAPWQARMATEMIAAQLAGTLSIAELASACDLSVSHFSRAFVRTLGVPPHRWLLERRVDRAKGLLGSGDLSLGDVSKACGFANQSHFSRVFATLAGTSPGRWRRRHQKLEATNQTDSLG